MNTLQLGDGGAAVTQLQEQLNVQGAALTVDGQFGKMTQQAVMQFQEKEGLTADGIVGNQTQTALFSTPSVPIVSTAPAASLSAKQLSMVDLNAAAITLEVPLACIRAVDEVESCECGFLKDGRPVILFERHIMYRQLKAKGLTMDQLNSLTAQYPDIVNPHPGGYSGGEAEYTRFTLAVKIDNDCAIESCSWGLFQIMGYHWQELAYTSINAFYTAMNQSEGQQLDAFVRFIKSEASMHQALKNLQWAEFAKLYNGPNYKENNYDTKLACAYAKYSEPAETTPTSSMQDANVCNATVV